MNFPALRSSFSDRFLFTMDASKALTRPGRRSRRGRLGAWTLEGLESRVLLTGGPPTVATGAALPVTMSGATLQGTVNPNGSTTTPSFQYSTNASFTPTVQATIGSGFSDPRGVAVDAAGDVFVADTDNNAVKEVKPNGSIITIGSGFILPTGVAVDTAGDVFVADYDNNAVKEVKPDGSIITIGSGFSYPASVAVDAAGDVFVADFDNNAVKEVKPDGSIITIGSGFYAPVGVAVDAAGDVFVADYNNSAVKEVKPDGSIITIGSGFKNPNGVAVDAAGDVFVADAGNSAVKEVKPDGSIITIGSGFSYPAGVAVDASGDVFVADDGHSAVKEVSPPMIAASPSPLTGTSALTVSAGLTGLTPGTTYYYRVVASSAAGIVADTSVQSFTTQIVTSIPNPIGGSVTFGASSVTLSGQIVTTPSTPFPTGSVLTVSIDNHSETATLNPNGSFNLVYQFPSALSVNTSPYTITYAFTDPSGTYTSVSDTSQSLTITRATPTVVVTDSGGIYNGASFLARATVAGVVTGQDTIPSASLEGVTPTLTYDSGSVVDPSKLVSSPIDAGLYTVLASFPGSTDYAPESATAEFVVMPKSATVTPEAKSKVYGSADPTLTGTLSGFLAGDNVTATYSRIAGETVNGGPYAITATLSPTSVLSNYVITDNTASFSIQKATPVVSYAPPAVIVQGTALGAAQLDATASIPGVFSYDIPAGTVLPAGLGYVITATFTPTDSADYNSVTVGSTINVAAPAVNPLPLDPVELGRQQLVTTLYQEILGRLPEPLGLTFWVTLLNEGVSPAQVAGGINGSAEHLADTGNKKTPPAKLAVELAHAKANGDRVALVATLYLELLGRSQDQPGLTYWTSLLASGRTPTQVAIGFTESLEYRQSHKSKIVNVNKVVKIPVQGAIRNGNLVQYGAGHPNTPAGTH
jgi:streptogramin lyase